MEAEVDIKEDGSISDEEEGFSMTKCLCPISSCTFSTLQDYHPSIVKSNFMSCRPNVDSNSAKLICL